MLATVVFHEPSHSRHAHSTEAEPCGIVTPLTHVQTGYTFTSVCVLLTETGHMAESDPGVGLWKSGGDDHLSVTVTVSEINKLIKRKDVFWIMPTGHGFLAPLLGHRLSWLELLLQRSSVLTAARKQTERREKEGPGSQYLVFFCHLLSHVPSCSGAGWGPNL